DRGEDLALRRLDVGRARREGGDLVEHGKVGGGGFGHAGASSAGGKRNSKSQAPASRECQKSERGIREKVCSPLDAMRDADVGAQDRDQPGFRRFEGSIAPRKS